MVNLLLEWSVLGGQTQDSLRQVLVQYLSNLVVSVFDPVKADAVFEQGGVPALRLLSVYRLISGAHAPAAVVAGDAHQ